MYQPFIKIWVGSSLMLSYSYVIVFCIYFYVMVLAMVWATVKDAAGMWHQDRFRPLFGAITNLALNLIMVRYIGLYGILLSTVISYVFVSMPWLLYNIFRYLYKKTCINYVKKLIGYIIICVFCTFLCIMICNNIHADGIIELIINGIIAFLVSNIIQMTVYFGTEEFVSSKKLVLRMLRLDNKGN